MKHITTLFLFCFLPLTLSAEHLFEAGLRAGMAGYDGRCLYVLPVMNLHAGVQFSYAYHSPHVIGFRIGATLDCSNAGYYKHAYTDSYSVIDVENEPIQVDYNIGRLKEIYTTWSVGIPVQVGLSGKNISFYLGPKIVFPLRCLWNQTADLAALSVYFPLQNNRVYNSFPLAASPSFRETQTGEQTLPKVQYGLAAELCYDIHVHTGRRTISYLSIGIYLDYLLPSIHNDPSDRISLLMLSDTREGFPLHRILTPIVQSQRQGKRLVSTRHPFDFGIKLSFRIAPYNPLRRNTQNCRCYGIYNF